MRRNLAYPAAAIILIGSLAACAGPATAQTQATQPPAPTLTPAPTIASFPTLPPTRTPPAATSTVLLTPPLPDWVANDFLFANKPPDCEPPCWQDLIPGESSVGETQTILATVLGFSGAKSFVMDSNQASAVMTPYLGLYQSGYGWLLNEDPPEAFNVIVHVEDGTDILQGLEFEWFFQSLSELDTNMSPQRIITELGPPSYILISVTGLEVSDQGYLRLVMIYEKGTVFSYDVIVPISFRENRPNNPTVELCIGSSRWARENSPVAGGEVDLMPPLTQGLNDLSPVQMLFIQNKIDAYDLIPIQDVLGVSVAEFTNLALQGGDACISADITGKLR